VSWQTVLAGSYDDFVYAYSVDYGRALGKMRVHDETVSCVQMTGNGGQRMVTASWDATVKLWGIAEGRGGWSTSCAGKQVIVGSFD
jgi:factor associated with neutral sphingomyelinase activation